MRPYGYWEQEICLYGCRTSLSSTNRISCLIRAVQPRTRRTLRTSVRVRGVNLCNLCSLDYSLPLEPQHNLTACYHQSTHQETDCTEVKMALLNVRSISNKTFTTNEQILSDGFDFLFMTETWLNASELGPLTEVCPKDFNFFNMTCGGGLATIYRSKFKCCPLVRELFSSCFSLT